MGDEGRDGDDGATDGADDATAEKAHQEGTFKREIGEAVLRVYEAKRDANDERRGHEEHELQFLVGIALFGKENAAEGVPASEESGDGSGHADLEEQGKEEVADCGGGVHRRIARASPVTLANRGRDVKRSVAYLLYLSFLMTTKSKQDKGGMKKGVVELIARAMLPSKFGTFMIYGFKGRGPLDEAIALVRGKLNGKTAPLVRVHSQCLTGDVLASLRCDCRAQLELSLRKIGRAGAGILLYLPQEGRGIGLMNKLRAYQLQDGGMDTVEANEIAGICGGFARDYDFSAQILKKLGARKIRLLSNNPEKVRQLEQSGIRVVQRVPCQPRVSKTSRAYLADEEKQDGPPARWSLKKSLAGQEEL